MINYFPLVFSVLGAAVPLATAQGVLRATVSEFQPGGAQLLGGVGYFRIGSGLGEFEIAVLFPFSESFTPSIYTPAGLLTFSLGSGEARTYSGCRALEFSTFLSPPPPLPYECPAFMTGTHYTGAFQSPPDVLAELLAGRGELRLLADSGTLLRGTMTAVVPEPSTRGLLLCGAAFLVWKGWRARPSSRQECPRSWEACQRGLEAALAGVQGCIKLHFPERGHAQARSADTPVRPDRGATLRRTRVSALLGSLGTGA